MNVTLSPDILERIENEVSAGTSLSRTPCGTFSTGASATGAARRRFAAWLKPSMTLAFTSACSCRIASDRSALGRPRRVRTRQLFPVRYLGCAWLSLPNFMNRAGRRRS